MGTCHFKLADDKNSMPANPLRRTTVREGKALRRGSVAVMGVPSALSDVKRGAPSASRTSSCAATARTSCEIWTTRSKSCPTFLASTQRKTLMQDMFRNLGWSHRHVGHGEKNTATPRIVEATSKHKAGLRLTCFVQLSLSHHPVQHPSSAFWLRMLAPLFQ